MQKVRLGVIGCGSIANGYHLPAIERLENVQLVYACDLVEDRAKNAMTRFGFASYTLDYREIMADPNIDAVCIFTKIEAHLEISLAAAKAGKHVFTQKPFAYCIDEGKQIVDAVRQSGIVYTPSFMHAYFPESLAARRLVEEGVIGDIENVRILNGTQNPTDSAASYGGCMMDIGCHGMDLVRFVTGQDIERVWMQNREGAAAPAISGTTHLNGDERNASLTYRLTGGGVVQHMVSWSHMGATRRFELEVYGTKGALYMLNPHLGTPLFRLSAGSAFDFRAEAGEPVQVEPEFFGERHHRLFFDDLVNGTSHSKNETDGFAILAIVEAARRSMETGR
ncbi:Gfo/Idh/MocA family oxidoreductase, partial [Ruminococcaceae bacterium OttesenSCG-928-L11]|nr:Gfo/Idh/MocA family oxidoreductase [Ruminococcaceae bacterium OttesenSCG-928-L11]